MKYIIKNSPPDSLETYKLTDGACFEQLPKDVKGELRKSLVLEQGGICCYCGKRVFADHHSVIEHFYPKGKEEYKHLQLEYCNLLCSCDGGESDRSGKTKAEKRRFPSHCDDKKNDDILPITPLDPKCEGQFSYDEEGHIYGITSDAQKTIEILGLDCSTLVNARRSAIDPYVNLDLDETAWNEIITYLLQKKNDDYLPFCFAAISYIRNFKAML